MGRRTTCWFDLKVNGKGSEWVLPQGHIETQESHGEAALREVREETGVDARLGCLVDRVQFKKSGAIQDAKFYLMECRYEVPGKESRETQWVAFAQAVHQLTYPEARYVVNRAENIRGGQL
jgi:8-oxo-dGTP pyrophosphatase MutT (NUDIX family)